MGPAESGGLERRRFIRRFIQFPVQFRPTTNPTSPSAHEPADSSSDPWQTTLLINISENGLFMTAGQEMKIGDLWDFQFQLPQRPHRIMATGRVLRVNTVQPGIIYECGVQFVRLSEPDRKLLADFASEPQGD